MFAVLLMRHGVQRVRSENHEERVMKRMQKRLLDFLYWHRRGNCLRKAWRLATKTL